MSGLDPFSIPLALLSSSLTKILEGAAAEVEDIEDAEGPEDFKLWDDPIALDRFPYLLPSIRQIIENGYSDDEDRSVLDFQVICELYKAGATSEEIYNVFNHYPVGLNGKYYFNNDQAGEPDDRYLLLTLKKAKADVGNFRYRGRENLLTIGSDLNIPFEAPDAEDIPNTWRVFDSLSPFQPRPEQEWLVEGVLPRPALCVFFGPPGSFKSLLLMCMAACVASGKSWLEPPPLSGQTNPRTFQTEQSPVLWIDQDQGDIVTHDRWEAIFRSLKLDGQEIPLHYLSMPNPQIDLSQEPSYRALRALLHKFQPKLIVIDTFARIKGGLDENDSRIDLVLQRLRSLVTEFECTIVLIHHANKNSGTSRTGDRIRGSTAIEGALDLAMLIERKGNENKLLIVPAKVRGYAHFSSLAVQFAYVHVPGNSYKLDKVYFYSAEKESKELHNRRLVLEACRALLMDREMLPNKGNLTAEVKAWIEEQCQQMIGKNKVGELITSLVQEKVLIESNAEDSQAKYISLRLEENDELPT